MKSLATLVFALLVALAAAAQQVNTLYSFTGVSGSDSQSGLVQDAQGNLYGTTFKGGGADGGVLFELMPNGDGTWTQVVRWNFGESKGDGFNPYAGVILDAKGNLYGATSGGGASGNGIVFKMTPTSGRYQEQILYSFGIAPDDGGGPRCPLVFDALGNLYGTGIGGGTFGGGTVYELSPPTGSGRTWKETILHNFNINGGDGYGPRAGVIFDAEGNLYGTTLEGGFNGTGTVFELMPTQGGGWKKISLHNFGATFTGGVGPFGGVIMDAQGNLYGTTVNGGFCDLCGTAYELSPVPGGGWTEKTIFDFALESQPYAGLIVDAQGNLYGTTWGGNEMAFQLSSAGGEWSLTNLGSLVRPGGTRSVSALVFGNDGNLYGATGFGGEFNAGTVFSVAP